MVKIKGNFKPDEIIKMFFIEKLEAEFNLSGDLIKIKFDGKRVVVWVNGSKRWIPFLNTINLLFELKVTFFREE